MSDEKSDIPEAGFDEHIPEGSSRPCGGTAREFFIVKRIIDSMRFLPDSSKVYLTIVDVVIDESEAENCSLMLLDSDTGKLVIKAAKGRQDEKGSYYCQKVPGTRSFDPDKGIAGKVFREGRPFLVADAKKESLFLDLKGRSPDIRSLLCVPIANEKGIFGVFNLSSSRPGAFNRNDVTVIGTIAGLAATALSTSLLYEQLCELNESLEEKVRRQTAILRASEDKYRTLVQGASDGVFIFRSGVFEFANRRFAEMMGYSTQNFSLGRLNRVAAVEQIRRHLRKMEEGQKRTGSSFSFEATITSKDGKTVDVEVGASIIWYGEGRAIQGIVRDITSRKEMERLKTGFLAMIAHELRTPITVIAGYNRMMLEGETGPFNPLQQKILKECEKSCDRLTVFAREVMDISRMEAGKMELDLMVGEIEECIKEAFREAELLALSKRIILEKKIPGRNLPRIPFDKNRIVQVLVNLLTNAINYTPEGGHVEVEALPPAGGFLEISVTDDGVGIQPEERKAIFDEYHVGKMTGSRGGVGLGLAICKKIIEAHGGKIWLDPERKTGSRFIFTLPISEKTGCSYE